MNLYGAPYGRGRACNTLSATDAAYIAGLIDGEGSIGLTYRRPSKIGAGERMTLHIAVSMTAAIIPDWLISVTGLGSRSKKGHQTGRDRAHTYLWVASSHGAYTLTKQIFPFLKLKDANAAALIRIHEELIKDPMRRFDPRYVARVKEHFHKLNYRGPGNWGIKEEAREYEAIEALWSGTQFSCKPWGEKLTPTALKLVD